MSIKNLILFLSLITLLTACQTDYDFILNTPKKIAANKALTISFKEKNNLPVDSVQFIIDGKKIATKSNSEVSIKINDYRLGKHSVGVLVFYPEKTKKITHSVAFMATKAPEIYTYKVVNTYPHDINAFTQGLEYHNGFLYETTGQNGASSLRKVELKTGKVLQKIDLDKQYFGEGMTVLNNKIHTLTWKKGIGFVFDFKTFKKEKEFKYKKSLEGWGFTNDGNRLIKSDGTERIWFLNPKTHKEETYIEAYTNKQGVKELNELEYVNGKIYANIWQRNSILIINPKNGHIEGVANMEGLQKQVTQHSKLDVLNGIAYDTKNDRLFVTGKNWDKVFEIKLFKK